MLRIYLLGILLFGALSLAANASEKVQPQSKQKMAHDSFSDAKINRIGGTFLVKEIKRQHDGKFQIEFISPDPHSPYRKLILETEHVHIGIQEGATLRLSADVLAIKSGEAEVSQVVLFIPGRAGDNPVWMLSSRIPAGANPPAKLLEMHAPSTDYMVF